MMFEYLREEILSCILDVFNDAVSTTGKVMKKDLSAEDGQRRGIHIYLFRINI